MADCGVNDCPPNIPIPDKQRLRVYSFIWHVRKKTLELSKDTSSIMDSVT